jgi:hypothetical protein
MNTGECVEARAGIEPAHKKFAELYQEEVNPVIMLVRLT